MRVGLYFWMSKDCSDQTRLSDTRESQGKYKISEIYLPELHWSCLSRDKVCYAFSIKVIWQNCGLWWLAFWIYLNLFSSKTFIRSGLLSQLSESAKINTMISSIIHNFGVPKDTSATWPSRKVLCINRQRLPEIRHLGNVKLWHILIVETRSQNMLVIKNFSAWMRAARLELNFAVHGKKNSTQNCYLDN